MISYQDHDLKGKVALVTGASRGLGAEIAKALARQGAYVVGTGTHEESAKRVDQHFQDNQLQGHGEVLDVTDPESIENVLNNIKSKQGPPLILVNNAGITQDNLMLRMKDSQWEAVIQTNLTSVFRLSKACLRDMLKTNWGRIVNISSVVGVTGNPGQANYAASKAGVIGFSKSLAQEVASRGITVNVLAPGFIESDMTRQLNEKQQKRLLEMIPMRSYGTAEDVAQCVLFFVSPSGQYITGQTLHVNGGMYMGH